MKVNLLRNSNQIKNGYVNLDIIPGEGKTQCDLTDLDAVVDDSYANEIVANNILEYYDYNKSQQIVKAWIRKLRRGGSLSITATDYRAVSKAVVRESLSIQDAMRLLYGNQDNPINYKKSAYTLDSLKEMLLNGGLKINKIELSNFVIFIEGVRPND